MKCDKCGKGRMVGKQHTHHPGVAGGRWKKRAPKTQKIFKPNLHFARVKVNGGIKRLRLCTKCLRLLKKSGVESVSGEKTAKSVQATSISN